ncbi:MAG TPA: flagellar basal-body rod protein FlgF [Bdellovibrionota bacterium]|jgi:flagellar basal-body rod protein FlgG
MSKGLWPAVSGSLAQSERLDSVANNLANADTNGFKRDQVAFKAAMSSALSASQKEEIPYKAPTEKDFHKLDGAQSAYAMVEGTYTDFAQGRAKLTGNPLDVALEGKGFLEVLGPQGVRFTRHGSLKLSPDGTLVTTEGFPVLNPGEQQEAGKVTPREELLARAIRLDVSKPGGQLTITKDGKIFQERLQIGQLAVTEFVDPRLLQKEGSSLYRNDVAANVSQEAKGTTVEQGMVETSNVNAVSEMVELLKATRMFEANEKVIRTYGDLEGRAVNDLGKL